MICTVFQLRLLAQQPLCDYEESVDKSRGNVMVSIPLSLTHGGSLEAI
jgi:hypothetical protein